jgi:hypothetical protein
MGACTGAGYSTSEGTVANTLEKQAAIAAVNLALSTSDCTTALTRILPLYNSTNTDNDIRNATAAAYGCQANINFFKLLGDFTSFGGDFSGSGFWEFMTYEFPSTSSPDDRRPIAAEYGIDALFSILNPGTILIPSLTVNSSTDNPGSMLVDDRSSDSNAYLTFMSMALMGSLQSRYGLPGSDHKQTVALPWSVSTNTKGDGCAFVSGLLNFYDGLTYIQQSAPSNIASIYSEIATLLNGGLSAACQAGCMLCGGSVSCTECPTTLRDRSSCTGLATDVNSCAAAGVINFVNTSWDGP